jgi:hypothetical protein
MESASYMENNNYEENEIIYYQKIYEEIYSKTYFQKNKVINRNDRN